VIGTPHSARPPAAAAGLSEGLAAIRDASPSAGVRSSANSGPALLQRPGPDTEGEVHSVPLHRNARDADRAPIDGLIGTRYTLEVCVVCGHERVHTPRQDTSCPECGATARRSFPLVRDLREVQR
jgi:rRNA maturation protein Nop10